MPTAHPRSSRDDSGHRVMRGLYPPIGAVSQRRRTICLDQRRAASRSREHSPPNIRIAAGLRDASARLSAQNREGVHGPDGYRRAIRSRPCASVVGQRAARASPACVLDPTVDCVACPRTISQVEIDGRIPATLDGDLRREPSLRGRACREVSLTSTISVFSSTTGARSPAWDATHQDVDDATFAVDRERHLGSQRPGRQPSRGTSGDRLVQARECARLRSRSRSPPRQRGRDPAGSPSGGDRRTLTTRHVD